MKKNRSIIFLLIIVLLIFVFYFLYPKNMYHGTTTSGLVVEKTYENGGKRLVHLRLITEDGTKEVIINVKEENLWNLIEEDRTYFINYSWQNNELPELDQIIINDEFKEIYEDQLNIKER